MAVCGDYRRLNMITTPDKYPLPNMQGLSNCLDGCSVFSKVDLVKGYHQIPVALEDIPKTAIITPFGLFEYLFTPFLYQIPFKHSKDVFLQFLLWNFLAAGSRWQVQPPRPITLPKSKTVPPRGHQAIATLSRHGKLLLPFLAKLCSSVAPFNRSPERGTADSAKDRCSPGVFSKS
jgi:hypothetical protein